MLGTDALMAACRPIGLGFAIIWFLIGLGLMFGVRRLRDDLPDPVTIAPLVFISGILLLGWEIYLCLR